MNTTALTVAEVEAQAPTIIEQAKAITITDAESNGRAATFLQDVKAYVAEITALFGPMKTAAHLAHKAVCDREKKALEAPQQATAIVKKAMADYDNIQQEIRRKQQEEANREALRKAEEERLELAAWLDDRGDSGAAERLLDQPVVPAPVTPVAAPEKPKGISFREVWCAEVSNANMVPREYMIPDLQKIQAAVRATKGTLQIPGVRNYAEKITAVR